MIFSQAFFCFVVGALSEMFPRGWRVALRVLICVSKLLALGRDCQVFGQRGPGAVLKCKINLKSSPVLQSLHILFLKMIYEHFLSNFQVFIE